MDSVSFMFASVPFDSSDPGVWCRGYSGGCCAHNGFVSQLRNTDLIKTKSFIRDLQAKQPNLALSGDTNSIFEESRR